MSQTTQKDLQRDPPGFEMHSFARNLCCQATNCDPDFLRLTLEALAWLKAHELPQMHFAIGYSNHLRLAKNGHCTQANRSHTQTICKIPLPTTNPISISARVKRKMHNWLPAKVWLIYLSNYNEI